jgi:hypothetical protein
MTKLCRDFERTFFSWSLQGFPQWWESRYGAP